MSNSKKEIRRRRFARQNRSRLKIRTRSDRPRLAVFRTAKHIYAQVIDDRQRCTVASASTMTNDFKALEKSLRGLEAAKWVGKKIAEDAKQKGIEVVVFDRGSFLYHGRVKALAEAARKNGLKF